MNLSEQLYSITKQSNDPCNTNLSYNAMQINKNFLQTHQENTQYISKQLSEHNSAQAQSHVTKT